MSWVYAVSSLILLLVGVSAWLLLRRSPAEATSSSSPEAFTPEPVGAER